MPIAFDCPHCGRNYRVADTNAGKRFACKECGNPVTIPGAQAVAAPARQVGPTPRPAPGQRPAPAQRPAPGPRPAPQQPPPPHGAPYGGQPAASEGPKTRAPNFVFLGGAAAMTIGFFLPWISIDAGLLSLNWGGYELPGKFNDTIKMAVQFMEQYADDPNSKEMQEVRALQTRGMFLYSIYLIPILCLAAAIEELTAFKKGRNWWWARAIAAASPVIAFITVMIAFSDFGSAGGSSAPSSSRSEGSSDFSIFSIIGIGVWLTVLGVIASVVGIFVAPKAKGAAAAMRPRRPGPPKPGGGPRPAAAPGPVAGARPVAGPKPAAAPRLPGGPKLPPPRRPQRP